jgi:antirestriction protein
MYTNYPQAKPAIYVGTYHKYNCGSIYGAWLYLDDYDTPEAFYDACKELHNNEDDPELMFQDYENFPRKYYSECGGITELYEYINFLKETHLNQDIVDAGIDLDIPLDKIEDAYQGTYDNDEQFAEQYADDCGLVPESLSWPMYYIDWQLAARDLMQGFNSENNHYFSADW